MRDSRLAPWVAIGVAAIAASLPPPGSAQGLSIQSISGPAPALGNVTSANSGDTVFQISASSGAVSRVSGAGYRVGGGSTRPLVTVACGSDASCASADVLVTVSSIGAASGRAGPLSNFSIDAVTAQLIGDLSGANPVSFTIAPIGTNGTRTFYIGADFPIAGDDSGGATGIASSAFQVSAQFSPSGAPVSAMATATATVLRPIALAGTADLAFGTIVSSGAGAGTVTVDAATGARTLAGNGMVGIGSNPHRATYVVTGEGGQAFSVLVPVSFAMTGPGDPITVNLTTTAGSMQTLTGALGNGGTSGFGVGGSFTLAPGNTLGAYSGTFVVTVQYQ